MVRLEVSVGSLANEAAELIRAYFPNETVDISENGQTEEYVFRIRSDFDECRWQTVLEHGEKRYYEEKNVGQKQPAEDEILYKRRIKSALKETVYYALKNFTGRGLPYGMLTGVRPVVLANRFLENNSPEQTEKLLQSEFDVSPEKAQLLTETSLVQKNCNMSNDGISLYIHIPFCTTRCSYCSFPSELVGKVERYLPDYMDALEKEVRFIVQNAAGKFESLYVGGGTPTALPHIYFERLMQICSDAASKRKIGEFTLEAGRPDTIDKEKLMLMKNAGVSRISINPQTMNDKTLELIGRKHTADDIIKKYELARSLGFDDINMDLIIGLGGETEKDVEHTFDEVLRLAPAGITVHVLAKKHASELNRDGTDIFTDQCDFSGVLTEYSQIFRKNGYMPYYLYRQKYMLGGLENAGYCTKGHACMYNIRMMDDKSTCWAAGAGSISKRCYEGTTLIERRADPKNAADYISSIDACIAKKSEIMD